MISFFCFFFATKLKTFLKSNKKTFLLRNVLFFYLDLYRKRNKFKNYERTN